MVSPTMPFGKYRGQDLGTVPTDYLRWLLGIRLSARLRSAVVRELARRGQPAPEALSPSLPSCPLHPAGGLLYRWQQDRRGGRRVRASCAACHRFVTFAPSAPPYSDLADAAASPAPVLDALIALDAAGVQLHSDGCSVRLSPRDHGRIPADLHAVIRECGHDLAKMIGRTAPRTTP